MSKKQVVTIPDRWLQGRCRAHELTGLEPRAALNAAIRDWQEQERLEAARDHYYEAKRQRTERAKNIRAFRRELKTK